jgi:DNA-binding response OmpR family regulator
MIATLPERAPKTSVGGLAWRWLPTRMRILYIATRQRTGGWLAEAFAADSATQVELEEAVGMAAGLARLRDEIFDAVLVSHQPDELNALDLIEGYRAGGAEEPIVVLGMQSEQEMAALCYEVGADGYLCVPTATTRNLIWVIARAVERHRLERENQRLGQAEQARLQREQEEAAHLLRQQRTLLEEQPACNDATSNRPLPLEYLPQELVSHYRELLRTYIIMGSGNLAEELRQLADALVAANLTAGQIISLHLHALEDLIRGLGSRSTRHVMNRADLLAMELLMNVADGFRCRYLERINPPVQQTLPGF